MDSPAPRSDSWPERNSGSPFNGVDLAAAVPFVSSAKPTEAPAAHFSTASQRRGSLHRRVDTISVRGMTVLGHDRPQKPILLDISHNLGRPGVPLRRCNSCGIPKTFFGDARVSESGQRSQTGSLQPHRSDRRSIDAHDTTTGTSLVACYEAGVIVLSSSGRMLHMNRQARTLMALFSEAHELWPHLAPESIPSILTEFCREVFAQLHGRIEGKDWAQLEVRRVCHMVKPPLLLRGFGVPHSSHQEPRMILTLQPAPLDASAPLQPNHAAGISDSTVERRRANS